MTINMDNIVSIPETDQDFSHVAQMVDKAGAAVVLKNDVPCYVVQDINKINDEKSASTNEALASAEKYLTKPSFSL